jgi:hypothetical protein
MKKNIYRNTENKPEFYLVVNGNEQPLILGLAKVLSIFDTEKEAIKWIIARRTLDNKYNVERKIIKVFIQEL